MKDMEPGEFVAIGIYRKGGVPSEVVTDAMRQIAEAIDDDETAFDVDAFTGHDRVPVIDAQNIEPGYGSPGQEDT